VTQLADVAVNRASAKFRLLEVDAAGSINKMVPIEIRIKKPQIDIRVGDCRSSLYNRTLFVW
jgi:hypothetical protein